MNAVTGFALSQASDRHSPCIGVCHLDATQGLCVGCGRTGKEIADWAGASDADKLAVYARLPERITQLGGAIRILPWTPDELVAFITATLQSGAGTWAVGTTDMAAAVTLKQAVTPSGRNANQGGSGGQTLTAVIGDARLTLTFHDKLRAYAVQQDGQDGAVVLGLPRGRAEQLLAQKLGPTRDWLLAPGASALEQAGVGHTSETEPDHDHAPGEMCGCHGHHAETARRVQVDTALARLVTADRAVEAAERIMRHAAALPRFATAMAVWEPAALSATALPPNAAPVPQPAS